MSIVATGDSYCCGVSINVTTVIYKYREGSILFSVWKAQKGIMEAVAIKNVRLISNKKTYGKIITFYVDTLNGLWTEDMLCSEADAKAIAIAYLQKQQQKLMYALTQCS